MLMQRSLISGHDELVGTGRGRDGDWDHQVGTLFCTCTDAVGTFSDVVQLEPAGPVCAGRPEGGACETVDQLDPSSGDHGACQVPYLSADVHEWLGTRDEGCVQRGDR